MSPRYRALVVSAHPDDIEFAAAGTLAQWSDDGADITLCIVTDGSTGTQDRGLMGAPLADIRLEETREAAEVIGATEVVWMGYPDGFVEYTLDLRRDIARVFRTYRPHRFMVLDPASTIEDRFINHPDHRAVGQASLDVVLTAGTTPGHFPELLDEGVDPWRGLQEVWVMGPGAKPVVVDITKTLDRKIEALLCHRSQVGEGRDEIVGWVEQFTARTGRPAGYAHAEAFQVIREGPGFHPGEQPDGIDFGAPPTPADPRAAPAGA